MKRSPSPRGGSLVTAMLAAVLTIQSAFGNSEIPVGKLDVDRALVRVGTRSNLNWEITYPQRLVETNLITTTTVKMRVRALGVAFQSGSTLLPFEGSWTKNSSAWTVFFRGKGPSVVPTNVLVDTVMNPGDQVRFRARGGANATGTSWFPFRQTNNSDAYAVVLKNGDTPPAYAPAYSQGSVKSFMTPYLDSAGRIKIGPQDLIILFEGSTAAPGTAMFDMQDLVLLVSFESVVTTAPRP